MGQISDFLDDDDKRREAAGAGSAAEQIRQESPNGLLAGRQAGLAGLSGVADAGFGLLGGKMAQRLGIGDVETMLAGAGRAAAKPAAQPVAKGLPRQMAQGALSEGVLEELPQSVSEQALQNIALDRPWQEDVDSAAVLGTLSGGVMGAGASGLHGLRSRPAGAEPLKPSQRMGLDANAGQLSAAAVVAVDSGASPAALAAAAQQGAQHGAQPDAQQGALQESAEAQQAALAAGQAQGPREAAALERVAALDEQLAAARQSLAALDAQAAAPDGAQDEPQQAARAQLAQQVQQLQAERESLTQDWPRMQAGKALSFGTESGAQLAGHWALAEADQLVTSHDEGLRQNPAYPQQLQPRERSRAASEAQIARMAQRLQPERLAHSADAATGAPIVGADGLVESGNARSIAIKRVYAGPGPQAAAYKDFLQAHAAEFGLTPEQVAGMQKPVLVRVRDTPVNRAEFARQANAPTVAMMSPAEQARADAARMDSMDGLEPDESGDFSGAASRGFVRRFMARLPVSEQAAMVDADGRLSSAGYARVRNAVLAKAWGAGEGGSDALARMTESLDDNTRSISRALMMAAPETARMREAIAAGARYDADIAGDVAAAAQEISRLREAGQSVQQALAQTDAFGDKHTPEARALMQFMADNARRPKRIAQLIQAYWQALDAAGDPHQQGMFGGQAAPTKQALLQAAMRQVQDAPAQSAAQEREAQEREAQDRAQAAWNALPQEGRHQLALAAGVQGVVARNAARHADWSGLPAAMQQRLAQAVGAASAAPGRDNAAHKSTHEAAHKSAHETAHKSTHESGVPRGLAARETADSRQLEGIINRNIERSGQEAAFKALAVGADQLPDALRGALAAFERATGARAVVFRNLTPHVADFNGVTVRDGTLFINETSQSPITGVAAHEWLHNLRRTHPALYHELAAEVARQGDAQGFARQWGYAPGEAQEELTAAAVGDAMTDPQFLARLAEKDGGLFARVAKSFLAFLDTLTARWRSQGSNAYLRDVQAFRDKLAAVLQAYEQQAGQAGGVGQAGLPQAMFQRVWHGTPHKGIEKTGFKLNKIGTGEGLQVYGHGIYFASRREVAEFYRGMRQGQVRLDGRLMTDGHHRGAASTGDPEVDALLLDAQGDVDKAIAWARDFGQDAQAAKLERLRGRVQRGEPGQLYAAEIPEDDDLLDWDKPLDAQPAKVRRALLELAGSLPADGRAAFRQAMARRATGQDVYAFLAQRAAGADASAEGAQQGQRAASELLLAHGIPGLRYLDGDSRNAGEGSHNYVIWDEGLLTPDAAQIAPQYSRKAVRADAASQPEDLYLGHNISPEGLRHALQLGGLAAPSLAVARTSTGGLESYGSITLLANKDLIGRADMPLFDADIYSPRQPRGRYKVNASQFRTFVDGLREWPKTFARPDSEDFAEKGIEALARREVVQLQFLKEAGEPFALPQMRLSPTEKTALKQAQSKGLKTRSELLQDADFQAAAARIARQQYAKRQQSRFAGSLSDFVTDDGRAVPDIERQEAARLERHLSGDGVDVFAAREQLARKLRNKSLAQRFDNYVQALAASLSDGRVMDASPRAKPYTLDNVVDYMTRKLRGGENFNYGAGSVRAMVAAPIRSVAEAQGKRGRIISEEQWRHIKQEADARLAETLDALKPYYRFDADGWGYMDDASAAIAAGGRKLSEAFKLDDGARKLVADLRDYLKGLPTQYFEMKAQRAMPLDEFEAAVAPKGTPSDLLDALRQRGLRVLSYDPARPGARAAAIERAGRAQGSIMFSRKQATQAAYERRIDELFAGGHASRQGAVLLDGSDVMGLLGHEHVPLVLNERHLLDGRSSHPEMTAAAWKRVPEWLENPAAVYDDPRHPGRLTVIAPERLAGYPVVMAAELKPDRIAGGHEGPTQLLVTAFAKTTGDLPALGFLAASGRLQYVDTKTAPVAWPDTGDIPRASGRAHGAKRILTEKSLAAWRKAQAAKAGDAPAFSLPESRASRQVKREASALKVQQAQRLVKALSRGWANAPEVVIASSVRDEALPETARRAIAQQESRSAGGRVEGFYWQGKVYLVAGNLPSMHDVARVYMHETLGHYGLRGVYGEKLNSILNRAGMAMRGEVIERARQYGFHGLGAAAKTASDAQVWDSMTDKQKLDSAEEALAYLAQTGGKVGDEKSLGLLRELVAAIRSWLRAHVPVFANLRYSDDEIMREFILPARRWVKNGSGQADDAGDVMFQLAWHGTPYRGIEKTGFRLDKIGTGEGAQAYGWGIYFASQRHVAEEYRRNLTRDTPQARYEMLGKHKDMLDRQIRQGGSYLRYDEQGRVIAQGLALKDGADMKGVVIQPYSKWKLAKLKKQAAELEAQMNELRTLLGPGGSTAGGQLYQTDVPEDKDLLIWDSPWNKQPLKVRRAVVNFLRQVSNGPVHPTQSDISRIHAADALKHRIQNRKRSDALTGKDLYTAFRDIFGGPKAASEALRAAGVPGLRYLDGMSRAGGEGTYNYVIWDEALLTPEAAQIAPQYSRKQATKAAYERRIDELFAGGKAQRVGQRVLDRSDVLGLLGHADKPVLLQESKVLQGQLNHPRMTAHVWKQVPGWLENPAAVFESDTEAGRLVAIAPETLGGAPVSIIVEPQPTAGGENLYASLLVNAYDRPGQTPFMRWIRDGLLRYVDKKKFPAVFALSVGRRLPDTALQNKPGTAKILTEKHLAGWRKLHAGQAQPGDEAAHFSRRAPEPLEPRPNEAARLKESALEQLDRVFSHPGTVSWWHKTVGTMRNLAERQPLFKPVYEAAQQFIDDVSHFANDAADFAPRLLPRLESWRDLGKRAVSAADSQAVAAPLFEGTLSYTRGKDGSLVKTDNVDAAGVVFTDAELKGRFGLTPAQIELYRQARAAIDRSIDTTARADILRLAGRDFAHLRQAVMDAPDLRAAAVQVVEAMQEVMQGDAKRRDAMRKAIEAAQERVQTAQALMQRGYAPLTRFGRYTLDVVDAQGQRQYFGLYESRREANVAAIHMRSQYPGAQVTQGTLSDDAYKLFAGITPESLELFGDLLAAPGQGKDKGQEQAFQAWLQLARNNRSAIKRLIHRKGVAGYSQDAGRVLASFIYANARQTAGALNAGRMDRAIAAIPKEQGQLRDVAMALRDYTQNPREEGQAIRGMLFAQYLGGSLASAAVNMTQPFAVTLPWLSQFGGMRQAAAQMTRALADMTRPGHRYEADLARDMKKAEEDGVVSPQEIHQLMAQARGAGALRSGDGTRRGDALAAAANAWERLKVAWGQPFALAEQFNRRSTYIAAWRLARQQGMADADAFARRAVLETQFVYTKANKARWGRGAVGGALFTFKTYSVSYLELMHRMWTQGGKPGKQGVAWMLAMLLLMGGAGGLPFMEDAEDLIDGLAQLAGYNTSVKQWRRQALQDIVGDGLAEFIESGVSGLPGAPIDISGRLGMGNLLPGTGLLLTKQNRERDLLDVAGPAGDLLARGFTAGRKLLTGDVGGAAMDLAPTAARNLAKGADMLATGSYRDAKGYKVLDTTALEALAKAAGFQPRSVAQVQEGNSFLMRSKSFYQHTSAEIKAQWARALFEKDEAALQRVRQRVADWNRRNPEQPITVRMPDIWRRVREMGKERSQRIADSAPRALRQQMRQALAQEG